MTPKIRIIQRLLIFFALLCALTALPGCGSREPGVCTVTYTYEGEVLQELQLTRGEALPAYTPEISGMRLVSWMDKGGSLVEPEGSAVNTDTVYRLRIVIVKKPRFNVRLIFYIKVSVITSYI